MIEDIKKEIEELQKYKNAWEEIMNFYNVELKDTMSKNDYFVLYKLKEIAKENGIEVK